MKVCMICYTPDETGVAPTCLACGEASWSMTKEPDAPEAPAPPAAPAVSVVPKSRKVAVAK